MLSTTVLAGARRPRFLHWSRSWAFPGCPGFLAAFALVGYVAAKRRFQGWLRVRVIGQGGSYVAILTALLVVNWSALFDEPSLWPWTIPTLGHAADCLGGPPGYAD